MKVCFCFYVSVRELNHILQYSSIFRHVCDGKTDCMTGDDEMGCRDFKCDHMLRCSGSKVCIHPLEVCDGEDHCPNGDDEIMCGYKGCPSHCSCFTSAMFCTSLAIIQSLPSKSKLLYRYLSITNDIENRYHTLNGFNNLLILTIKSKSLKHFCTTMQGKQIDLTSLPSLVQATFQFNSIQIILK